MRQLRALSGQGDRPRRRLPAVRRQTGRGQGMVQRLGEKDVNKVVGRHGLEPWTKGL